MGDDDPAVLAQRRRAGLQRGKAREAFGVHHVEAARRDGQQVGVVGWAQAADKVQGAGLDIGLPVGRVAAGVVDHRQRVGGSCQRPEPGDQLLDHRRELGHVRAVALVGVMKDRHAAVAGHHQPDPDQAQVEPLLLGVAARRDGVAGVGGVDEGREVGHVQHQPGKVQVEDLHHPRRHRPLDGAQVGDGDRVHGVPEATVVQRRGRELDQPVPGSGVPPGGKGELGARRDHPVEGRQGQVGADRGGRIRPSGAHDLVDDRRDLQALEHRPGAARSPNARWRVRVGSPGPAAPSRAATSSALPR